MSEKQWYEDMPSDDFEGKHVKAVMDSGAVVEGRLALWIGDRVVIFMVGSDEGITVLLSKDGSFSLTEGMKSLDLVWDERDWERIDVKDLRAGDAVVANGRLYKVSWAHVGPPQVVTDTPGRMLIDLRLVSCALRRKAEVKVPMEPGYYRDRDGGFWKMWLYSDGHAVWQPMLVDIGDTCHMNSTLEMKRLMPLTPVHFESGRAA